MDVEEFRQILLWPLAISRVTRGPEEETANEVRDLAAAIFKQGDGWEWVPDGLAHIEPYAEPAQNGMQPDPFAYQEFVYFHDFVARFLYQRGRQDTLTGSAPMPAFHLFRLPTLKAVEVGLHEGQPAMRRLSVERCNLYLFRTGVVILALEVSGMSGGPTTGQPWNLDEVMRFSDVFRRTYTPYFTLPDHYAAAVPLSVKWVYDDGVDRAALEPRSLSDEIGWLSDRPSRGHNSCDAPVADHWSRLLPSPLVMSGGAPTTSKAEFQARHILDERMAVMSYIRLEQLKEHSPAETLSHVQDSDWARLCFVDQPGQGWPYSKAFLDGFDRDHAYDRFRDFGTRHLFSSYSYVMVCVGDFARDTLVHHFRRMYFQMALLSYMEQATYVAFSSRVSEAIDRADEPGGGGIDGASFKNRLFQLQRDLIDFVHRFRFTGVSNQVQAIEMYAAFRRHLRLDTIFTDVKAEMDTATTYLRAKDADEQSASAEGLNVVAFIGVALGLAIGMLGALPNLKGWVGLAFDDLAMTTVWVSATFFVFALAAFAMMQFSVSMTEGRRHRRQSVRVIRILLATIALMGALGSIFGMASHIIPPKTPQPPAISN